MTRDEEIKELLYDIERAKGNYDEIESLLLRYAGKPSGYKLIVEFTALADADDDKQEQLEAEMILRMEELEEAGIEPDMLKIRFYSKE